MHSRTKAERLTAEQREEFVEYCKRHAKTVDAREAFLRKHPALKNIFTKSYAHDIWYKYRLKSRNEEYQSKGVPTEQVFSVETRRVHTGPRVSAERQRFYELLVGKKDAGLSWKEAHAATCALPEFKDTINPTLGSVYQVATKLAKKYSTKEVAQVSKLAPKIGMFSLKIAGPGVELTLESSKENILEVVNLVLGR